MRKLVFMLFAIAAISFTSCGNKTAQGTAQDSDTVVTDTVDTVVVDTLVNE